MRIKVVIRKKENEWDEHGETNGLNSCMDSITFKPISPCL